ncbi:MAG TPA: pre-peptidase C-terminal domain-containing protein [Methanothrix sp.]|nr:pre-peptidase C-terminal domain-containing protein [Methanothrix sp.]
MNTKIGAKLIASLSILIVASAGVLAQDAAPDDFATGATDIGTVGAEGGRISSEASLEYPGEIDWFKFTVEAPTAEIVIAADMIDDLRIVIYDDEMNYVTSGEGLLMITAEAGTYLVRIDSIGLEEGDYSIALSNLFEAEPNDCITDGNDLGPLAMMTIVGGSIEPMGDIDYFLFEVDPESEGYVMIAAITTEGLAADDGEDNDEEDDEDYFYFFDDWETVSLVLYGYNESEGSYLPIDHGDNGVEAQLDAGKYAVRAESESQEPISGYVLAIGFANYECDDEPNDTPEEPLDLGVLTDGVEIEADGCILPGDDVDYYVVVVEEALEVAIETSGDSDGDSYLYLYDEEMEETGSDDDDGDGSWSKIEEKLDPGTYYIRVESFWGGAFPYTLMVTGTNPESEGEEA